MLQFDGTEWEVVASLKDSAGNSVVDTSEGSVTSSPLDDGQLFFNKADSSMYFFDAVNHKFIKAGGKRHYVVDAIVDYIGTSKPNDLSWEASGIKLYGAGGIVLSYAHLEFVPPDGFCFATIRSSIADEAGIYSFIEDYDGAVHIIHDLYDGDTVFNKADEFTYTFSDNGTTKSFIKSSSPVIKPVLDFAHIGPLTPEDIPTAIGDKFIDFDEGSYSLYTAPTIDDWGTSREVQAGERYASLDNHKIYDFSNLDLIIPADIPIGANFLNKANNCLYTVDGTNFVNVSETASAYEPIAPVLAIISSA